MNQGMLLVRGELWGRTQGRSRDSHGGEHGTAWGRDVHQGMDSLLCLQRIGSSDVVAGDEAFTPRHQRPRLPPFP